MDIFGIVSSITKKEVVINIGYKSDGVITANEFRYKQDLKIGDSRIIKNKEAIMKLVTHYIINEKNQQGLPINDVSRFHLGNGAIVDDIIVNANVSEQGFKRSYGVMVNYLYELKNIEKNHEDYMNNNKVIVSDKIKKYL